MKTRYLSAGYDFSRTLLFLFCSLSIPSLFAQVQIRDTALTWQTHAYELNDDYSLASFSMEDSAITGVVFTEAKVIENELIRLIILPEYGARVISFVYKPTGYEYLYQSECGSPYGIGQNNVYYRWLLTYGGIFPSFPGPQYGEAWLLPWQYSVVKQTADTVTIRMEYTDNSTFTDAPVFFSTDSTLLTCRVDISVYRNSAVWDFDVSIINDQSEIGYYEYWTCATLAPGSDIGDTGTPLNSQIVTPAEQYLPGWSEEDWMLPNNRPHFVEDIDYLDEWKGPGVAYIPANNTNHWGVINQDRKAGVFRLSENEATPTLRVWSWGRENIDNDLFDFSNGGADNYFELWAGVPSSFFQFEFIEGNTQKSWRESYCPTVDLSGFDEINRTGAIALNWIPQDLALTYDLNLFHADQNYSLLLTISKFERVDTLGVQPLSFSALGIKDTFVLDSLNLPDDVYTLRVDILDQDGNVALTAEQKASFGDVLSVEENVAEESPLTFSPLGDYVMRVVSPQPLNHRYSLYTLKGEILSTGNFNGNSVDVAFPTAGLYVFSISDEKKVLTEKVLVRY